MDADVPSVREALESAMDSADESSESAVEAAPVESPTESDIVSVGSENSAEQQQELKATGEKVRDDKGRFAPSAAQRQQAVKNQPQEKSPSAPLTPSADGLKPPQSWKPEVREEWAKIPPSVQQEIHRREKDITASMSQAMENKAFKDQFKEAIGPFEGMIRAEGSEPLNAVRNLLQTAAALRTAPAPHKAQLVANLVKTFGVDIGLLDQALADPQALNQNAANNSQGAYRDPRVDELLSRLNTAEQQRIQALTYQSQNDVESFGSGKEYFEDVRDEMADILELAAKRKMPMSLEDAYNRAINLHPEISKVLRQREEARNAQAARASTQRARAAASSIRSSPASGGPPSQSGSLREQLEAAYSEASGR